MLENFIIWSGIALLVFALIFSLKTFFLALPLVLLFGEMFNFFTKDDDTLFVRRRIECLKFT